MGIKPKDGKRHKDKKSVKKSKVKKSKEDKLKSKKEKKSKSDKKHKKKDETSHAQEESNDSDDAPVIKDQHEVKEIEKTDDEKHVDLVEQSINGTTKTSSPSDDQKQTPALVLTSADIIAMEYNMKKLQESIKELLEKTPNQQQLESFVTNLDEKSNNIADEKENSAVLIALSRSMQRIKLASKLKTMWEEKKLNLFEQIANFEDNSKLDDGSNIELSISKTSNSGDSSATETEPQSYPPPIPEISDPIIKAQVFTHKSCTGQFFLTKQAKANSSYERLEFLGDAVLQTVSTDILFQRYTSANEGELSSLRSHLVRNTTLVQFSKLYGLDKHLQIKLQKQADGELEPISMKIVADIFEAYIGGLFYETRDYQMILDWFKALVEPELQRFDSKVNIQDTAGTNYTFNSTAIAVPTLTDRFDVKTTGDYVKEEPVDEKAKNKLYALIGGARCKPDYKTKSKGNGQGKLFVVNCVMGKEVIGTGSGRNKSVAGLRAAMDALKNSEIVGKYNALRMALPDVVPKVSPESKKNEREVVDDEDEKKTKKRKLNDDEEVKGGAGKEVESSYPKVAADVELPVLVESSGDEKGDTKYIKKLDSYLMDHKCLPKFKYEKKGSPEGMKTTLIINDEKMCYCIDDNKKASTARLSKFMLMNPQLFPRCDAV
ncbi:unnamed protein product [Ambrosiozyma monospora]|uniref:Unnamed protein product n=1 Tax=Ambrosiozyma monospora TaxID=43982 RepID=A0ACB5SQV3_AMBMO|nr:unnamed protein product [Ambrosiozyma monospora]